MAKREKKAGPYAEFGLHTDEDVAAIRGRIHACHKFGEAHFAADAASLLDYYAGKQFDVTPGNELGEGDHRIVINKTLPNVETKVNTVAFGTPEFILKPRNQAGEERKALAKSALEYYFEHGNVMRELKAALHDSKIVRYGAVRITWKFETDEIVMQDGRQDTEGDLPRSPEEMVELASQGIDPGSLPMVPRSEVTADEPCVERIRPTDLFFDPASDWDLDKSRFVVYRELQPLEDIRANPRFDPKVTSNLKGKTMYDTSLLETRIADMDEADHPADLKMVTLWHYYERRRRLHCVYADEDMEKPLLVEKFPWKFRGYPFAVIIAHVIPDKTPGECQSDVDVVRPVQDQLNTIRSLQVNHLEQLSAKFQCKNGTMTPHSRRQLRSSRRFTVVEHNGQNDQSIFPLQQPNISADVYRLEDLATRDVDYLTGVSDYMRNMFPAGGRKTATEVAAVSQTGSSRVDSDVIAFSEFAGVAARKMLGLLQQYHAHVQTVPVYDNDTNVTSWAAFSSDAIRGEFDLQVTVGSTQAKNKEAEKQDLLFALQTMTPYASMVDPATGQPVVNIIPLLRKVFETFGIQNAAEIIQPYVSPAPPMQPAMPPAADPAAAQPGADPMAALAGMLGGG